MVRISSSVTRSLTAQRVCPCLLIPVRIKKSVCEWASYIASILISYVFSFVSTMVELVEMVQNLWFFFFESPSVSHFCKASSSRTTSDARDVKYASWSCFPTVSISWVCSWLLLIILLVHFHSYLGLEVLCWVDSWQNRTKSWCFFKIQDNVLNHCLLGIKSS